MQSCRTSCNATRCWSSVSKRLNLAWTPLSKSSQIMPMSGAIARPGVAVRDLSPSSNTPSPIGCLTVASSPTMTRRKFWQSRPKSGEPHWPSSMFTSPCVLLPSELWLPPSPIDPAEQLLPRSYRSALSQLRSGHCSRLQAYRHSVGWADDPTCPDCRSTYHTVAHLFSCPTHPTDPAPGDMWTAPLQVAQFLAGLPQFYRLAPIAGWLWLLPFITLIPAVDRLLPDHQQDHIILTSPPLHLTRGPGVISLLRHPTTTTTTEQSHSIFLGVRSCYPQCIIVYYGVSELVLSIKNANVCSSSNAFTYVIPSSLPNVGPYVILIIIYQYIFALPFIHNWTNIQPIFKIWIDFILHAKEKHVLWLQLKTQFHIHTLIYSCYLFVCLYKYNWLSYTLDKVYA